MKYGLTLVTAPAIEPLTLEEVKGQVRVSDVVSAYDDELLRLLTAARQEVEDRLNRQLITATWNLRLDRFPTWPYDARAAYSGPRPIYVPRAPLQSVSSITYTDTAGATQTVSTSVYKVVNSKEPGEIWLKYGQIWPIARWEPDTVVVQFVAGYGDAASAVPAKIKQAILLTLTDWFENRMGEGQVSETVERLLANCMVGDEFTEYGERFYAFTQ